MNSISIVIVTWNSVDEIIPCLRSVLSGIHISSIPSEIIVVDNNSTDDTLSQISGLSEPAVRIVKNSENLGYTKAINQGIELSTGKYVLLLNPDTILHGGALKVLYGFLDANTGHAACAPLMVNPDGTIQYSVRNFPTYWRMFCEFSLLAYIFPKTKLFGSWKAKYIDYSIEQDVYQPMAAAFMIRRSLLNSIGNMDERFRMFFNDVDLCKKVYDAGFKIKFLPTAVVTHAHGISIKKDRAKMITTWNNDCELYFNKHHNNTALLLWLKLNLKLSGFVRILAYKILR
jgi:GT2 family glycosyltransferase